MVCCKRYRVAIWHFTNVVVILKRLGVNSTVETTIYEVVSLLDIVHFTLFASTGLCTGCHVNIICIRVAEL